MVKDEPGGVKCTTQEKEPWLRVGPGSTIKDRGRPAMVRPNGDLDPAIIVESGPNTCLTISAVQLTQELAANREAVTARCRWPRTRGNFSRYAATPLLTTAAACPPSRQRFTRGVSVSTTLNADSIGLVGGSVCCNGHAQAPFGGQAMHLVLHQFPKPGRDRGRAESLAGRPVCACG